jgi:hypothetical protein
VEPWFQDEARIGQKTRIPRRGARRGTRPHAPHGQRAKWAYILGAIRPGEGKGAGLVLPWCDTSALRARPIGISAMVAPDAHAVLILDQAGGHLSGSLEVPANIGLPPLPPESPELNPVENVRRFPRDNRLSNRVFKSHDDIVAHRREAWNEPMDQPWRISSIGRPERAHGV